MNRVCIFGFDSLAPRLLFDEYWDSLPNFKALAATSLTGELRSCDPPITVPAWAAMVTGVDPGTLGVYGFRDRSDHSYDRRALASSLSYPQPPLWHILSRHGIASRLIGVPQTYPPKPLLGCMVTGCLTPPDAADYTYPQHLAAEVQSLSGGLELERGAFRDQSLDELVADVRRRTAALTRLGRAWIARRDWQFFMMVDMGADRLQHALWRYCCSDHPRFVARHPLREALRDYYVLLDTMLGQLLDGLRPEDMVWVVSDHGAQPMHGGVAINDWLIDAGYLVLRPGAQRAGPLPPSDIDWTRTTAWGDGGYVGRIHLNMRGREPCGTVAPDDAPSLLARLAAELSILGDETAQPWQTTVHTPAALYREVRGVPPDLFVYFDALRRRAVGSVGHRSWFVADNDTGPDGANHAHAGVVLLRDGRGARRASRPLSLYDVAPSVLEHLNVAAPKSMIGSAV